MREVEAYRRFKYVADFALDVFASLNHPQTPKYYSNTSTVYMSMDCAQALILAQDSAVVQDPEGEGKIVYLFLPLYQVSTQLSISHKVLFT